MNHITDKKPLQIEIEGVKLTEKAIVELRILQSDGNFQLHDYIDKVSDLVFFLLEHKDHFNQSDQAEVNEHIQNVGHIRNILKSLLCNN